MEKQERLSEAQDQPAGADAGASREAPPLGRYHDMGSRRLLLHQSGEGSPAVVFLPGAGLVGLDYLNVQRGAAELTTSVVYDRGGTGWSDPLALPRSAAEVTDELRDLLVVAGVHPPYLLVGHSLGGLYARHYAQRFPDEVAALLLMDPGHEDYDAYRPRELSEMRKGPGALVASARKGLYRLLNSAIAGAVRWAPTRALLLRLAVVQRYRTLYRALFMREMADWPEPVREVLVERHVSPDWLLVGIREVQNVDRLSDEVRRAGPVPDVPMIVLCSTETDDFGRAVSGGRSESLLHEEIEGRRRLYTMLAGSVPRGEIRPVDAGHVTMHLHRPDDVLQAIRDLLEGLAT
jgi:pimeloyl-ACP methyl ester carboxylesterase